MLAHVLDWQRVELYTHFDDEVGRAARAAGSATWSAAAPRGRRWPTWSAARSSTRCPSTVSPAVLIPRPESEFVVVEFLALTKGLESPRAVDVGTGSGCLAIASASRTAGARFVAIDISDRGPGRRPRNAAAARRRRPRRVPPGRPARPVAGEGPSTSILSNPPYIPTGDIPTLERASATTSRTWPSTAAPTASTMVARLIEESVPLLKPGGHLILEIGTDQEKPVRALIAAQPELPAGADDPRPRQAPAGHPGDPRRLSDAVGSDSPSDRRCRGSRVMATATTLPRRCRQTRCRLAGTLRRASGRVFISAQRSSFRRAVSLRRTSQSSSESLGFTTAGSSGSVLIRWSIIVVVLVGVVRQAVGEELEGEHAEGEDVDPLVDRLAAQQLGGHVLQRPGPVARAGGTRACSARPARNRSA